MGPWFHTELLTVYNVEWVCWSSKLTPNLIKIWAELLTFLLLLFLLFRAERLVNKRSTESESFIISSLGYVTLNDLFLSSSYS